MTNLTSIRKVVMGKKVAAKYIQGVSTVRQTLTLYFNDERSLVGFEKRAQNIFQKLGREGEIIVRRGFDYLTYVVRKSSEKVVTELKEMADEYGIDYTEM